MSEPFAADSVISHYRIVSRLGAGGMGEVYLAQDTKLDRNEWQAALEIWGFAWSKDARTLAVTRDNENNELVLIENFR